MNPRGEPLLDEKGVTITRTHLTTPGHLFDLSKIHLAKIERVTFNGPIALLLKREPVFRLIVWPASDASPICAFETGDVEFVARIQRAIDQAAKANP